MCWPCCHKAIYRLDASTGTVIWSRDWGPSLYTASTVTWGTHFTDGDTPASLDSDGTYIYAGGGIASLTGNLSDTFNVMKLDGDGQLLWTQDVGSRVLQVMYVSGIGVVVCHDLAMASGSYTIVSPPFAGGWYLADVYGDTAIMTSSDNAATVQANLEAIPQFTGLVSVSGSNIVSGLTITLDSSLFGPTGRRPAMWAVAAKDTVHATRYGVTVLDASDGSILWGADPLDGVRNASTGYEGTCSCVGYGSNVLIQHHRTTSTSSDGLKEYDSSGSLMSSYAGYWGRTKKSLTSNGTDVFASNYEYSRPLVQQGMQRFTSPWGFWNGVYQHGVIVADGSNCWQPSFFSASSGGSPGSSGNHIAPALFLGSSGAYSARQPDTSVNPPEAPEFYNDMCLITGSKYAITQHVGCLLRDASYANLWTFSDGSFKGQAVCDYGGDVIYAQQRQ